MKRGKVTQLLAVTFAFSLGLSATMIAGAEDVDTEEAAVIVEEAGATEAAAASESSEEAEAVEAVTEADILSVQSSEASDAPAAALDDGVSSDAAGVSVVDQEDAGETYVTEAWLVSGINASANGVDWDSASFGYVSPATRWTITRVDGGYTVQDSEGNYLSWDVEGSAEAKVSAEETVLGISNVSYDGVKGGMSISLADGDSTSSLSAISETSYGGVSVSDEDSLFYIFIETVNGNTTTWTKVTDVNEISNDGTYIIINRETCCALMVSEESVVETEEASDAPVVVSAEESILVSIEAVDEESIPDAVVADEDAENVTEELTETEAGTEAAVESETEAVTEEVIEETTESATEAEVIVAEEITIDVVEETTEVTEAVTEDAIAEEADVIIE